MAEKRVGGILRRDPVPFQYKESSDNELLVFGYQCKLYRDDVKALSIDQGRHLIPCPSNTSLKVDRYDVRGALHDLTQYEPPPGGYVDRYEGLTLAERKAEELCEEERYYDLYHNDVDEELYQDDSNSNSNGAKIAFNYDEDQPGPKQEDEDTQDGTEFEPFIAPVGFYIPPEMDVPESMKQHAVIEKTAKFISSQGLQMEILLKAKQSNNPQFSFLIHDDSLFPYYKHMLEAIKNNVYPIVEEATIEEKQPENNVHHSSTVNMEQIMSYDSQPSTIPVLNYTPSQDCVYFKLMNTIGKISGAPIVPQRAQVPGHINGQNDTLKTDTSHSVVSSSLKGLVAYTSDTDESNDDTEEEKPPFDGPMPPEQILHIINTTVNYVVKNGDEFEGILRQKQDARFDFLNAGHEFYTYYMHKLGTVAPQIVKARQAAAAVNAKLSARTNNPPGPVSFSIKPKEETSSSVINTKAALTLETNEEGESVSNLSVPIISSNLVTNPGLEEKLKEVRRAEEQIRNKLAAAAREKLGHLSKEEQLRQERKMKAKSFLAKLQQTSSSSKFTGEESISEPVPPAIILPAAPSIGPISCESDDSIHSLPEFPESTIMNIQCSRTESTEGSLTPSKKGKHKKHRKKEKKSKKSHKRRHLSRSVSRDSSSGSYNSNSKSRSKSRSRKRKHSRSRSSDRRYRRRS